ncbi:MAG: dihydrolipoamide acetyltransferase family protein [Pseudomonadota bacterium]|nr:dihydrolipoamide acetyltransferase family protein [Pseudomonadota bacterium]
MAEFRMPSLGADMEAGTLVEWLVAPGDPVERGQVVAVVETQKGAIEVETFETGVVEALLVAEHAKVPVGTVLATIREAGVGAPPVSGVGAPAVSGAGAPAVSGVGAPAVPPSPEVAPLPPAAAPALLEAPRPPPATVRSSPSARVAAHALGVDLATVTGTGPHGAVRRDDVERAAAERAVVQRAAEQPSGPRTTPEPSVGPPGRPPARGFDPAAMRAAIAAAMARSKREIPHYYLAQAIDLSRALTWLAARNASVGVDARVLPAALFVRAVARAAREVPEMNGFWIDGAFQRAPAVHPGVAIALRGGGLVAPALRDADQGTLAELMGRLSDLVARTRAGRLRASEMSDPTLTVTNLGDLGVDEVIGVIYPPQVALVGFGRVADRPWAVDGLLGVRPVVHATLAADHRASDGHRGGLFLARIDALLQDPEHL